MSQRGNQQQQQQQQQSNAAAAASTPAAVIVPTPAAAATAIAKAKIDFVQMDALVLLKILKHCQESGGGAELSQGILTGMIQQADGNANRIEITNCFGLPNAVNLRGGADAQGTGVAGAAAASTALTGTDYNEACNKFITDNLKTFRYLNVDHLIVGWYQSALFGTFVNKNFIEDHFMYQNEIKESVVLIYDPFKTQYGSLSIKAYRLTPNLMELEERKEFTPEAIKENRLTHENFMEEIPIVVKNSHLVNSLLCEVQDLTQSSKRFNFLDLSTNNVLEKVMRSLIDNVDELSGETNKYLNYHKQLQKQNHLKQQYLQKREAENSARRARGEPPLPDEDINKIFKPLPAISRLEPLLISNQIKNYSEQINEFASHAFTNLFIAEGVQNK